MFDNHLYVNVLTTNSPHFKEKTETEWGFLVFYANHLSDKLTCSTVNICSFLVEHDMYVDRNRGVSQLVSKSPIADKEHPTISR